MYIDRYQADNYEVEENDRSAAFSFFTARLRNALWLLGIPSWLFGIVDRSFAAMADGYISAIELVHLFMAAFFFVSWLYLKPEAPEEEEPWNPGGLSTLQRYQQSSHLAQTAAHLQPAQNRMFALREHHVISQEYTLPMPYLCQIYHLLNLKHLESVHSFSLSNLRIIKVSEFQPTMIGGRIKFQTVLDSSVNILRIWRQPIVEVDLTLHGPYTVELSIPIYGNKRIIVMFNALPLNQQEHQLLIDIYSNIGWFKPLLQIPLHIASCLTLFEDLPYLRKLAEKNLNRLVELGKVSNHETMLLFSRFVDLYGSSLEALRPVTTLEVQPSQA